MGKNMDEMMKECQSLPHGMTGLGGLGDVGTMDGSDLLAQQ